MRVVYRDASHTYLDADTGDVLPGVTSLLHRGGHVDDRWYTEEGRRRGREVHRLTADYDLGLLGCAPKALGPKYKAQVLAYAQAVSIIQPEWSHVEEVLGSGRYRFAGTPDRVGLIYGARAICEIKNGAKEKWHGYQTALQAILAAEEVGLPGDALVRYVIYLGKNGRWSLEEYPDRGDFREAYDLIGRFCRKAA